MSLVFKLYVTRKVSPHPFAYKRLVTNYSTPKYLGIAGWRPALTLLALLGRIAPRLRPVHLVVSSSHTYSSLATPALS
jgi:hypothetical protein